MHTELFCKYILFIYSYLTTVVSFPVIWWYKQHSNEQFYTSFLLGSSVLFSHLAMLLPSGSFGPPRELQTSLPPDMRWLPGSAAAAPVGRFLLSSQAPWPASQRVQQHFSREASQRGPWASSTPTPKLMDSLVLPSAHQLCLINPGKPSSIQWAAVTPFPSNLNPSFGKAPIHTLPPPLT